MNTKSPLPWPPKSYNAVTYKAGGSEEMDLGFGGGGGLFFFPAAAAAMATDEVCCGSILGVLAVLAMLGV